jgi:hypothetical protein
MATEFFGNSPKLLKFHQNSDLKSRLMYASKDVFAFFLASDCRVQNMQKQMATEFFRNSSKLLKFHQNSDPKSRLMYASKDVFAFFLASDCQVQNT